MFFTHSVKTSPMRHPESGHVGQNFTTQKDCLSVKIKIYRVVICSKLKSRARLFFKAKSKLAEVDFDFFGAGPVGHDDLCHSGSFLFFVFIRLPESMRYSGQPQDLDPLCHP